MELEEMTTLREFNRYGEELERILILRTSPLAVKMLEKAEDIPEGAVRPKASSVTSKRKEAREVSFRF
jgi:uncharacterized protein (DUF169 family)